MAKSIHTDAYRDLVKNLAEARIAAGMTQQALADRLCKPQSYVAKVEGYERRLDVAEFLIIAREIGIDPISMLAKAWDEILKV